MSQGEHYTAQALLGCLVRHRLTSEAWQRTCSGPHLLSALQCVRVLSRDANLHGAFDDDRWHGALAGMLARLGALHLGHPVGAVGARPGSENGDDGDEGSVQEDGVDDQALDAYAADLLVEAVSIVRHLSSSRPLLSRMLSAGVPHRVSVLLSSRDPALVPVALLSLAAMARDSEGHEAVVTQARGGCDGRGVSGNRSLVRGCFCGAVCVAVLDDTRHGSVPSHACVCSATSMLAR